MMTTRGVWVMYDEYMSGTLRSSVNGIYSIVLFEVIL